ncbi:MULTISPECIES: hypothetical protein [Bacillus]|uniref:hypothetical protein n=1 Tax=Bacillus TaxID=1386 RepID=UPI000F7AE10F|nr:hypothetical protein EJA13_16325 [Bacillus canaveralius]
MCLGDIVFRGPQPSECIELIQSINPIITVRGNVEDLFNSFPKPDWKPANERQLLLYVFLTPVYWINMTF